MENVLGQTGINKFAFVDVDFIGFSREETLGKNIDYQLLKTMKDAGLVHINLGIESWADSQLRRYGKASTRLKEVYSLPIKA